MCTKIEKMNELPKGKCSYQGKKQKILGWNSVVPPLPIGNMFQVTQWMPVIKDDTKPYIYYIFSICTYL